MNVPSWMAGPPACLLLATDLSGRCDRALDRAAQLVAEWGATLLALNVVEAPLAPDRALAWAAGESDESRARFAQRQLQHDLGDQDIRAVVRIGRGDTAGTIREAADGAGCGLIVTGMARNEVFGRFLIGSTVERLARTVSQPLMVVRNRVRGPYRRIVVASDFSESSRHALNAAARFFPDRELVVYHACQVPLSGLADKVPDAQMVRDIQAGDRAAFLAGCDLPAEVRSRLRTVIEFGAPEPMRAQNVRAHDVELVVMGTHGRSGVMSILLGSVAGRLLDWLPCDTLTVREPRAVA